MTIPQEIPAPAFGLNEQPPTLPSPWTTARSGFYYVDESATGATDVSNPFGTPAKPRLTVPTLLPAGAVVLVRGKNTASYSSPNTILAQGTAPAPVFLIGIPAADGTPCRFTRDGLELTGSYFTALSASFYSVNMIDPRAGGQVSRALALRNCDVHGDVNGGGVGIGIWHGGSVNNCVISGCDIHDTGDVNVTTDVDNHGVAIGGGDHHWVLNTTFERCSGDGVQVNGGQGANWASLHHVFVGGCTASKNRQSGFWSKQAADVIFARNTVSGMRPNSGGPGLGLGGQYGPLRLWLIGNKVSDCENGLMLESYDAGFGTGAFLIHNIITNIHATQPTDIQNYWSGGCALFLKGSGQRLALNNTVYDCDSGVQVPATDDGAVVLSTIFAKLTRSALAVESTSQKALQVGYSLFDTAPKVNAAGTVLTLTAAQLAQVFNKIGDPMFIDTDVTFALQPSSPAMTGGVPAAVLSVLAQGYNQLYGGQLSLPVNIGAV